MRVTVLWEPVTGDLCAHEPGRQKRALSVHKHLLGAHKHTHALAHLSDGKTGQTHQINRFSKHRSLRPALLPRKFGGLYK